MNVIGERVTVLSSTDPTKVGLEGTVMLETANTLKVRKDSRTLTIEKKGAAFRVKSSGEVLTDAELSGRLEDRWGRQR